MSLRCYDTMIGVVPVGFCRSPFLVLLAALSSLSLALAWSAPASAQVGARCPGSGGDFPCVAIVKQTIGGAGTFSFTIDGGSSRQVQIDTSVQNPNQAGPFDVEASSFTVTEEPAPGSKLTSISCVQRNEVLEFDPAGRVASIEGADAGELVTCTFVNRIESVDTEPEARDERMRDVTRLFTNRRVDNLLSHDPDRARMLRRLQPGHRPVSLKDEIPPLKLGMRAAPTSQSYGQPYSGVQDGLFANQDEDDQPWAPRGAHKSSTLSSIMRQLSGATGNGNSYKFGTSFSQLREAAAAAHAREQDEKLKAGGLGFAGKPYDTTNNTMRPGLDVWVEGHFSRYDDGAGGIDREGRFRVLYAGADYPIARGILVGALVQIDDTQEDVEDASLSGEVEGTGWMAGPYLGIRLMDTLFFDARAAWGRADNDIWLSDDPTGFRNGSFNSDRWLATAKLTGRYQFGAWRLSPEVGLAYGNESYDTYLNSLGQIVDSGDATIGRFNGGAEVGYVIQMRDGAVLEPHVALKGIWNFKTDDVVVGGVAADTDRSRGRVEAGMLYRTATGWAVRGAGAYDGIGSGDFDAYSGQLWLNVPLN